jgi:hypothetical protein
VIGKVSKSWRRVSGIPIGPTKTMVLERNTYGRGVRRFHAGFLDYARHAGFLPRLCQPYRAQTKGKVERFIGYLKGSFWVPFVASMRQAGLQPDKRAANAAVRAGCARWQMRACTRRRTRYRPSGCGRDGEAATAVRIQRRPIGASQRIAAGTHDDHRIQASAQHLRGSDAGGA